MGVEEEKISPEKLVRFFQMNQQGNGVLSEAVFCKLFSVYYKVVTETVVTSEFVALDKTSKVLRKINAGELVEALDGPRLEESVGVQRIQARALKDGCLGWVSVASNMGTAYLKELEGASNLDSYRVVKATTMTDGINSDKVLKELKKGEIVERLEFPKKNEKSALRLRCCVKDDKTVGWVTINDGGDELLQLCGSS